MHGGFIWDDSSLITDNELVKANDGLYRFWLTTEAPDYYPLTWSLWWLEWRLWGASPMGYHVVNVLLHAANAVLVWMVLRRLKIPAAWLVALMFAVHPVNVATVAWISEQKNTLSMLFYAMAILLYLRFDEEGRLPRTSVRGWRWYGLSLAAFLLALLSKTAVVMLPFALLGCVWWRRGRITWNDLLRSVPFFALSVVLGLATIWFQYNRAMGGHPVRTAGFLSRLATAGWVPWFYLHKALLPLNLNAIYSTQNANTSLWTSYLPGLVLVGCLTLFWWKRKTWGRPLVFALGYFVVTLFPVMGFFDQWFYQSSLVSDHWQYYSIVGVIALTVAAGAALCRRTSERSQSVGVLASVVVLAMLGVATWTRASVWGDAETLMRDTLRKNPGAWAAEYSLGVVLRRAGRVGEAIRHYQQALRIKPDHISANNNLGMALLQQGRVSEAIEKFGQALRIQPDSATIHNNLACALLQQGSVSEAVRQCEQALRLKPDYADAHNVLGSALLQSGKVKDAIRHFQEALRFKPDHTEAECNLGIALARLGRPQEALAHFERALQLKPDSHEVHYNMGIALELVGNVRDAIAHYEQALRIRPDYAEAHYNLGLALEQEGRVKEAIKHYEQALRIKPDFAEARNKLARLRVVQ